MIMEMDLSMKVIFIRVEEMVLVLRLILKVINIKVIGKMI